MDNRTILLLVAAVLIGGFIYGFGAFLAEAKDSYYDYVAYAPTTAKSGDPVMFTVKLAEKNGILSNCDKPSQPAWRISPDTAHYCPSFTYFNARSIRVSIDGQEVSNFYYYPANLSSMSISSSLSDMGSVCCFGAVQACSVCQDQNTYGLQYQRAYFFGRHMAPQTSLDNGVLFTLSIPESLSAGQHVFEVIYFAETTSHANDNTVTPEFYARLGGQQQGDNNNRYNYFERFTVSVTGTPPVQPPQVPINTTQPPTSPQCSAGTYDAATNTCIFAPSTQIICTIGTYDASSGKCIINPIIGTTCLQGTFNPSTNLCEITPPVVQPTTPQKENSIFLIMVTAIAVIALTKAMKWW